MPQETTLKGRLAKWIQPNLPGSVVFCHEDRQTFGIPDISVTWYSKTTWWELKHADPTLKLKEQQHLRALQLEEHGYCRYLIFLERKQKKNILIVKPSSIDIGKSSDWREIAEKVFEGFDYEGVTEHIRDEHLWLLPNT